MKVYELRKLLVNLPDDAGVYFWVTDDEGDRECHNPIHVLTVPEDSPAETSIHFDHD